MNTRLFCVLIATVTLASLAQAEGQHVALCIGINDCKNIGTEHLRYAESDVIDLAAILRDGGYQVVVMTRDSGKNNPKLAPNHSDITTQFDALLKNRKREDVVVIVIVGISLRFDDDPDLYFCPLDALPPNPKTLISFKELYQKLGTCEAGVKLVIADVVHIPHKPVANDILSAPPPKDTTAVYACSSNECSYDLEQKKHGAFIFHVLKAINKQKIVPAEVELSDLTTEITREVPKTVSSSLGQEKKQTPVVLSNRVNKQVNLFSQNDMRVMLEYMFFIDWLHTNQSSIGFFNKFGPGRIHAWKAAAEHGSPKGMVLYARCLQEGIVVQKNETEAFKWFMRAAEFDQEDAMYYVGNCYREGCGVQQRNADAIKWLNRAAERGQVDAMSSLAGLYYRGEIVAKSLPESIKWARQAADCRDPDSMCLLGLCYLRGEGLERNANSGVFWFRKAAEMGHPDGMFFLGRCYGTGEGVRQDYREAVKWLSKSAELGNSDAMAHYAWCLEEGRGVAKNEIEAVKLYRKAAELGNTLAMHNLGTDYWEGTGVVKDVAEALKWYRKAAELGNSHSMYVLGHCYHTGEGIAKDLVEAIKWYRKSSELGNPNAMYELGSCYQNGEGVKVDRNEAVKWYRKAAELGSSEAKEALKSLDK